jgi:hypothetical protein
VRICSASVTLETGRAANSVAVPPPTATPDLIATAGQAYLAAVGPLNAVGDKVAAEERALGTKPYKDFVKDDGQYLVAREAVQKVLYQIAWPPAVQGLATALVEAIQSDIGAYQDYAGNPDAATSDAEAAADQARSDAPAAVRLALHLPPVPN